jgi:hypothetical protein
MSFADRSTGATAGHAPKHRAPRARPQHVMLRVGMALLASGALAAAAVVTSAGASTQSQGGPSTYSFTTLAFPGASATRALGITSGGEVVGTYTMGTGSAVMHGFTWTPLGGFHTLDDPNGVATMINGVNHSGDAVGFYTDKSGNTVGFLATAPQRTVRHLKLTPMPVGTVSFGRDSKGELTVGLNMFGLTPGSAHTVELAGPNGSAPVAQFSTLTASSAGQADMTLASTFTGSIPSGGRLVILNGSQGGSVADEPIAGTSQLSPDAGGSSLPLTAVEVSPDGTSFGTPKGQANVVYDPAAQTLTVTVNASGLTPGNHAAHIHLGSCTSQGPVKYMLMDFVADSQGKIAHESRVISGVTTAIPASGWYLNIHQGTSSTIVQNGQPTIFFRPLLCSDITNHPGEGDQVPPSVQSGS